MNRINQRTPQRLCTSPPSAHPVLRPTQRLRDDADSILRDVAYVLHLTGRVKAAMLEERELTETAAV